MAQGFAIFSDSLFLKHQPPTTHPESPSRLHVIHRALNTPLFSQVPKLPCDRQAKTDELLLVHTPAHVDLISSLSGQDHAQIDADTYTCKDSFQTACLAVGTVLNAVDVVHSGKYERAFAIVRPPGHHAKSHRAMGFCLFNNIALGVAYAMKTHNYKRIAIYDFDVHHGNGTQEIFQDRPDILFISHHQYPFYPGTGAMEEVGSGEGKGYSVNCPLTKGMGDQEVLFLWDQVLGPVLEQFQPELMLISAGYDAHVDDPIGQLAVTDSGYYELCLRLEKIAQKTSIPIVYALEGGYNKDALANGIRSAVEAYRTCPAVSPCPQGTPAAENLVKNIQRILEPHWTFS